MKLYFELDGDELSLDIPFSVHEITFNDFCDFKTAEAKFLKGIEDKDGETATWALIEALNRLIEGPVNCLPLDVKGDDLQELIESEYRIGIGDELSVNRLYVHIITTINTFLPESIPEVWELKSLGFGKSAFRVLTKEPLTTGEALELLEFQRRAARALEETPHEVGNIDFTLGLTELALLCRKKGEHLPSERPKLDRFLNERRKVFAAATMDEILTLRFFLHRWLARSTKTRNINFSGTVHRRLRELPIKKRRPGGRWLKWRGR